MTNDRFDAPTPETLSWARRGHARIRYAKALRAGFRSARAISVTMCLVVFAMCCAANPLSGEAGGSIRIEDRWPQIFQLLADSSTDTSVRAAKLIDYLRNQCPEVADRLAVAQMSVDDSQRYLFELEQRSFAIRSVARRFNTVRSNLEEQFIKTFPDFRPERTTVYLTVSRFRFDGKVPHDRLDRLLIALDGIAKFHGARAPMAVIFAHELFHLYHFQVNRPPVDPDQLPLYRLIWQEGLACYVSSVLNPTASLSDVLFDPRLAIDGPKFVTSAARRLLSDLSSTDDAPTAEYLTYRAGSATPARMGYLIGYLIVARLAKDHSLVELAHLRDPELRLTMRRGVRYLAEHGGRDELTLARFGIR
jgi:Predicted Zn-dependent protease (DUF2268)